MLQKSIDAGHVITSNDNNHGKHWICVAAGTISSGKIVRYSGTSLSHASIVQAAATEPIASDTPLYVAMHGAASGEQVEVSDLTVISDVNTSGSSVGAPIFLSDTSGGWSLTAGTMRRRVGVVLVVSATVGVVVLMPNAYSGAAGQEYVQIAASGSKTDAVLTAQLFDKNYTIKANRLRVGSVIRVRAQGIHTASAGADTHTMALTLGPAGSPTTIASKAGINPGVNDIWYFDMAIYIRTATTMIAAGVMGFGASGTATANIVSLGSTAIDVASDNIIGCFVTYTASVGDACRLDVLDVKIEN